MKKIYKNPSIEVIKIKAQQLLAGSEIGTGAPGDAGGAESRESFDDFDWDEEE